MVDPIDLANFGIASAGLIVALLGLLLSVLVDFNERWVRRFFIILFSTILAYVLSDLISQISLVFLEGEWMWVVSSAAVFLESLLSSFLMLMMTAFLIHIRQKDFLKSNLFRAVAIVWAVYAAMLVINLFTNAFYGVDENNVYYRGDLYPILLVPPVMIMMANITALIRRRKALSYRQYLGLLYAMIIPVICMVIQMIFYSLLMIVLGTAIASFILFIQILIEQREKLIQQVQENAEQRVSIMMLQMRPHFISNTLSGIYYLCEKDPVKAQQVIADFTTYLRKNFLALEKQKPVPFKEELEHVKAYLAVEKVRFGDSLYVDYDISYSSFELPALSLQPLVENSVKHGIDPEEAPLHVFIRTCRTDTEIVVRIEDTGSGYNELPEDNLHIGIRNVRERLAVMCQATLELGPRQGGGTVAEIRIPDVFPG